MLFLLVISVMYINVIVFLEVVDLENQFVDICFLV